MRELTPSEMVLTGTGRCGNGWQSMVVETTFTVAAGLIGYGVTANPVGAYYGARVGLFVGGLICRSS